MKRLALVATIVAALAVGAGTARAAMLPRAIAMTSPAPLALVPTSPSDGPDLDGTPALTPDGESDGPELDAPTPIPAAPGLGVDGTSDGPELD